MKVPKSIIYYIGLVAVDFVLVVFIADRVLSEKQIDISGKVITAMVTMAVGGTAGYMAWRQSETARIQAETAREKLRLDLFDKRYQVAEIIFQFHDEVLCHGEITQKALNCLIKAKGGAAFLFGEDVVSYLDDLWEVVLKFRKLERSIPLLPVGDALTKAVDDHMNILLALTKNYPIRTHAVLMRYLRFL